MLLSEKLSLFLNKRENLVAASILWSDRYGPSKITATQSRVMFEENSALHCQIIGSGDLFVGASSYVNNGGYIRTDQGGVFIGRYCSVGRRVSIGAGSHRVNGLSTSPALRGVKCRPYSVEESELIKANKAPGPVIIESDVWIGDGVILSPGIKIGIGSVVASNSVVTKDVEPYQIVGGVPAISIGSRFDASVKNSLIKSNWWEFSLKQLNALPLANVFEFILVDKSFPAPSNTFINKSVAL